MVGNSSMSVSDFCSARNINNDTVTSYIRNHPEIFGGHTEVIRRTMYLDEFALRELERKYKLPTQVLTKEYKEELDQRDAIIAQAKEKIERQQRQMYEMGLKCKDLENERNLLQSNLVNIEKTLADERAAHEKVLADERTIYESSRANLQQERDRSREEVQQLLEKLEERQKELAERDQQLAVQQQEIEGVKNYSVFGFLKWRKKTD